MADKGGGSGVGSFLTGLGDLLIPQTMGAFNTLQDERAQKSASQTLMSQLFGGVEDPKTGVTFDTGRPGNVDASGQPKITPDQFGLLRQSVGPKAFDSAVLGSQINKIFPAPPTFHALGRNGGAMLDSAGNVVKTIPGTPAADPAATQFINLEDQAGNVAAYSKAAAAPLIAGGKYRVAGDVSAKPDKETFGQPVEVDSPDGPMLVRFPNNGGPPVPVPGGYKPKSSGDLLSDDALDMSADQILAGDSSVMQGLGYGNVGAKNRAALRERVAQKAKDQGITGSDLAAINAQFFGVKAGERTLGTRSANIDMAVNEASNMGKLARDASTKVPRGKWMPVNKAMQAWNEGTGTPEARQFGAATNSFLNAYATAVGKGTMTVDARNHAQELLSTADGPKAYEAIMDQLDKEMQAAKEAPGQVRSQLRDAVTGKENAPAKPAAAASAPANGVVIQNGWKYDAVTHKALGRVNGGR